MITRSIDVGDKHHPWQVRIEGKCTEDRRLIVREVQTLLQESRMRRARRNIPAECTTKIDVASAAPSVRRRPIP